MTTFYCKVEDLSKNQYILTDKFKQPLICDLKNGNCVGINFKKIANDPTLILKIHTYEKDYVSPFADITNIPCSVIKDKDKDDVYVSKPIDKEIIKFNNYDIATFNKDIVIKDKDDKQYTGIEIEQNFPGLYELDKDNQIYLDKMKLQYPNGPEGVPLNIISEHFKKKFDYDQKFLTKEDSRKVDPNAPTPATTLVPAPARAQVTAQVTDKLTSNESDDYMYIGIGIFVLFIFAIAFGFYILKQKNQSNYPNPPPQFR
jgi:hypothetical protein